MRFTKILYLGLLLTAGAIAGARATEHFRTDINPALTYYQALILEPKLSTADQDYLLTNEWRGQHLEKRFGEILSGYDKEFRYLRHAGQANVPCDWGIDLSPGPDTLLPHLARFKMAARIARLRAMWDLQNGDQAAARDDLLAAFAMGRNLARDGVLISGLVQIAIENIVCSTVAENFNRFSPETLQQIVAGMDAAPARFKLVTCVDSAERTGFGGWLAVQIQDLRKDYPGNEAKVMEGVKEKLKALADSEDGKTNNAPAEVINAAGGTSDGILKLVNELDPYYVRMEAIMALPWQQCEAQEREFVAEVQKSSNPLVSLLLPALGKAQAREFTILVKLAMVHAAVEYKLRGQAGLISVVDPVGQGPFAVERYVLAGVDRGFQLQSTLNTRGVPEGMIFVEKDGLPFFVDGAKTGQAAPKFYPKD